MTASGWTNRCPRKPGAAQFQRPASDELSNYLDCIIVIVMRKNLELTKYLQAEQYFAG
jgi:hypothetical protein